MTVIVLGGFLGVVLLAALGMFWAPGRFVSDQLCTSATTTTANTTTTGASLQQEPCLTLKERTDARNEARRTWLQVSAGAGVAVAGLVAYERLQLSRAEQMNERFVRAVELLSYDEKPIDVRLGGIYSLEQIAPGLRSASSSSL